MAAAVWMRDNRGAMGRWQATNVLHQPFTGQFPVAARRWHHAPGRRLDG